MLGAWVHPGRLVSCWKAEDGVCDQQAVLGTSLEKEKTVAVKFSNSMMSYYAFPGGTVCAHSCIEITHYDELVCTGNSGYDSIQVLIELVFDLVWVGHSWRIGTYNGDELLAIGERNSHGHQAVVNPLWGTSKLAHKGSSYGKAYSSLAAFVMWTSTPKESIS